MGTAADNPKLSAAVPIADTLVSVVVLESRTVADTQLSTALDIEYL
jgi:hypothetical protein